MTNPQLTEAESSLVQWLADTVGLSRETEAELARRLAGMRATANEPQMALRRPAGGVRVMEERLRVMCEMAARRQPTPDLDFDEFASLCQELETWRAAFAMRNQTAQDAIVHVLGLIQEGDELRKELAALRAPQPAAASEREIDEWIRAAKERRGDLQDFIIAPRVIDSAVALMRRAAAAQPKTVTMLDALHPIRKRIHDRMSADADTQDEVHPCEVWSMALRFLDEAIEKAMGYRVTVSSESNKPLSSEAAAAIADIGECVKRAAAPSSGNDKLRRLRARLVEASREKRAFAYQNQSDRNSGYGAWANGLEEAVMHLNRLLAEPEPSEPPAAHGLLLAAEGAVGLLEALDETGAARGLGGDDGQGHYEGDYFMSEVLGKLRAAIAKARGAAR